MQEQPPPSPLLLLSPFTPDTATPLISFVCFYEDWIPCLRKVAGVVVVSSCSSASCPRSFVSSSPMSSSLVASCRPCTV
ncbi:hypothetical protein E2C01_022693 [Portunus trituberculatus]|uniref:Uncharacterized protein n=1 Tax=Portunus trituberculatus TaxID=210409 RepID=A0A5B7E7S6_PORTR|nr:hypothetical protein [Portunus trituberculatus]